MVPWCAAHRAIESHPGEGAPRDSIGIAGRAAPASRHTGALDLPAHRTHGHREVEAELDLRGSHQGGERLSCVEDEQDLVELATHLQYLVATHLRANAQPRRTDSTGCGPRPCGDVSAQQQAAAPRDGAEEANLVDREEADAVGCLEQ
eukprot:scaffold66354_cov63-Phaeocystis_antarctica.AAC.1